MLPIAAYKVLKKEIDQVLENEYVPFTLEDYVDSPVALARIKASLTQAELAERMGVSQAYISKLEAQHNISPKTLVRVIEAIRHA